MTAVSYTARKVEGPLHVRKSVEKIKGVRTGELFTGGPLLLSWTLWALQIIINGPLFF